MLNPSLRRFYSLLELLGCLEPLSWWTFTKYFHFAFLNTTFSEDQIPHAFNSARKRRNCCVCRSPYIKIRTDRAIGDLAGAFFVHHHRVLGKKVDESLFCKYGITLFGEIRLNNSTLLYHCSSPRRQNAHPLCHCGEMNCGLVARLEATQNRVGKLISSSTDCFVCVLNCPKYR